MKKTVYQIINDRIIEMLEAGTPPWRKAWAGGGGLPINFKSKKAYRGINTLMLAFAGFESPTWLTFKQAKEAGGCVKKGEKSTPVIFWNWIYKDANGRRVKDAALATSKVPFLRYYNVFNVAQCEGVIDPSQPAVDHDHEPIEEAVKLVENMPNAPTIQHDEARAYYRPATDTVNMPRLGLFDGPEEYHSTLFHELVHSTGHESRLNRQASDKPRSFGSEDYSKEELVAEMGAAMLCGVVGIDSTIENSAAYIQSWIKVLKGDPEMAVKAGAQAQRAADHIQGVVWDK